MSARTEEAAEAAIGSACRLLHLPTVRDDHEHLALAAASEHLTHRAYLAEVLTAEVDEREGRWRARRVVEARLPRVKRLWRVRLRRQPQRQRCHRGDARGRGVHRRR